MCIEHRAAVVESSPEEVVSIGILGIRSFLSNSIKNHRIGCRIEIPSFFYKVHNIIVYEIYNYILYKLKLTVLFREI